MDNLLQAFDSSLNVSFNECDTFKKHPRFSMYKEKLTKSRQEERRNQLLQAQKEKKITVINVKRGIVEKEVVNTIEKELMQYVCTLPKSARAYKDVLMLSEWLVEVPEDFYDKWIVVPCPVGKRVLIVAEKGGTVAYARKGFRVLHKFSSGLPGGSRATLKKSVTTRLDAIWNEASRTLYIIDVLELGPSLVDCECDFRFMWLEWKFEEYKKEITESTKQYKIELLDRFRATKLVDYVKNPINPNFKMDGLLFFHEEGLYEESTKSPLVTWLKPFMLRKVLKLETHPDYLVDDPLEPEDEPQEEEFHFAEVPPEEQFYPAEQYFYTSEIPPEQHVYTSELHPPQYIASPMPPQHIYTAEIPSGQYMSPIPQPHMYAPDMSSGQYMYPPQYVYTPQMPVPQYIYASPISVQYIAAPGIPSESIPMSKLPIEYINTPEKTTKKRTNSKLSRKHIKAPKQRRFTACHIHETYDEQYEMIPVVSANEGVITSVTPPNNNLEHNEQEYTSKILRSVPRVSIKQRVSIPEDINEEEEDLSTPTDYSSADEI